MTRFASVQASVAQPFFDAAPLPLRELERMAEDAGLPASVVSQPKGVISLHAAERFMVQLDRRIKHPTYFLETLRMAPPPQKASVANIKMPRALTGIEAVETVARRISSILYGAGFLTQIEGDRIWLLRTAGTTDWTDRWPVQQYNLEVGLQSVQRVIGRPAPPRALRLSSIVPSSAMSKPWRDLPITLCRRTMGMAFDLDDLQPDGCDVVVAGSQRNDRASPQEADVRSLRRCLETFLGETAPDCLTARMAKAFGMSARSYRRHLGRLGLTHRQLVSDARLCKAEQMLPDASVSITEIAFELGYTHSPAFTRFFKGRTGKTPERVRMQALG